MAGGSGDGRRGGRAVECANTVALFRAVWLKIKLLIEEFCPPHSTSNVSTLARQS